MAGGLLDDLDFSKLPWAQPTNASPPPGAVPGDQPEGVLSGMAPTGASPAAPPPDLNEAGFMQAAGPGEGAPPAKSGLGGLLSRLTATDPSGVTFANKLMAAGSMLKGQGGQAMDYLQQQRDTALKQRLLARSMASKQAQAQAFYQMAQQDKSGRLAKMAPFVAAMGPDFDLGELAKAKDLIAPKNVYQSSGHDLVETEGEDPGHVLYRGHGEPPVKGLKWDDAANGGQGDWVRDEAAIAAMNETDRNRFKAMYEFKIFPPQRSPFFGTWAPPGSTPLPP
jgi:hypothetical protein